MLGLSVVPALIMLIGLLCMPESPRWLVEKEQLDKAEEALKKIHNVPNVEDTITAIHDAIEQQKLGENNI